jgi:hypothetical protein
MMLHDTPQTCSVRTLDPVLIRRRAEALAFADTRTLTRALYGETQTALACAAP